MSARKTIPTHRRGVRKHKLSDDEMAKLVRLLQAEPADYDTDAIRRCASRIANRAESLLEKDQIEIIATMRGHIETLCTDETLKSRLLAYLDGRKAA